MKLTTMTKTKQQQNGPQKHANQKSSMTGGILNGSESTEELMMHLRKPCLGSLDCKSLKQFSGQLEIGTSPKDKAQTPSKLTEECVKELKCENEPQRVNLNTTSMQGDNQNDSTEMQKNN